MGGAYGEWTYRAPPGSSRTSGGTALPPATPVGQIYTMYIDFPLEGNTPNPRAKSLGRHTHIFSDLLGGPPGGVLAPSCSKSAGKGLEAGGPAGNRPKSPERAGKDVSEACAGPWRPLEAPGGPWRPLEARPLKLLETPGGPGNPPKSVGLGGPERGPEGPLAGWRPPKPACGPVFFLEGARRRSFRGGN